MVRVCAFVALWALVGGILLGCLLVTGCAPTIEYRDRVHRVEIPVPAPCLEAVPDPVVYPYQLLPAGSASGETVRAARHGLMLHRQVEADLRELLEGCARLENGP